MNRIISLVMVSVWCLVAGCAQTQTKTRAKPKETAKTFLTISGVQTNPLGMIFVPVKGTTVLFSVWETRVQDYQAFVTDTGRTWRKPSFEQGPTHPAVNVSWDDAKTFCAWLIQKERAESKIGKNQEYRLPTDAEWSVAVGLGVERRITTANYNAKYPWGRQWPPPPGVGNYASRPPWKVDVSIADVDDYRFTSPVGSFTANQFGLYDLGGNAMEWCEDWFFRRSNRVMRGGSWSRPSLGPVHLLSSSRWGFPPDYNRDDDLGFRCVLVVGGASTP